MSSNIKGITVEIGGDTTKLGKALEDVNKKSRDLSSELGQVNKLLKMDPGNADLLAQKQKILSEAVANTSKKLETLKMAEKQVQEQFERGEVSEEQVRALQREIIATTSKLKSYENASEETAEEIKKLGENSENSKKDIDKLGDEAKKTGDELDKAGDKGTEFGDKISKAGGVAVKGFAVVATAAMGAVTALAGASVSGAEYADNILTMSTVTGISTDKLQEFTYASELVDVSVDTLTKSMAKNIKSMASAKDGSKAYADAYKQLGISVTDANGNLRDGETVYWEAIDALGQISNETERDALAMQLFGKSAQELNPLIEAGSEKMKELGEEAHEVGAVLDGDALNALGSFDDSIQRLKGSAGATKNALGGVLLPELQMLTDTGTDLLNEFTRNLNASGGGLEGLVSAIDSMSGSIVNALSGLATNLLETAAGLLPTIVNIAFELVTSLAMAIIPMLPQLVQTGIDIILALLAGLTQSIPQITIAIMDIVPVIINQLISAIPQLLQGAITFFMAIVQAIPTIVTNLISALPSIITTIIDAVIQSIPILLDAAIQLLNALIDAIPVIIDALIVNLPSIIDAIISGLLDALPLLLEASITLFFAIIDAIPTIVSLLIANLPRIISTIVSSLINAIPKLLSTAGQLLGQIITAIGQLITKLPGNMGKVITAMVNGLKNGISRITTVGKNIVEGLWNGINNMTSWIAGKIKSFCSNALDAIKAFFGIKSPSRVMRDQVGKMLGEGMAIGIDESKDIVLDSIDSLMEDTRSEFQKVMDEKNKDLLEAEKFYAEESARIAREKEEAAFQEKLASANAEEKLLAERNKALLDSEKKYNAEKERIEKARDARGDAKLTDEQKKQDKADDEYLESLKKTATEERELFEAKERDKETIRKAYEEKAKKEEEEATQAYLDGLKEAAEMERKIYEAEQKDLEKAKQAVIDTYRSMADEAYEALEDLESKFEDLANTKATFAKKLTDYGDLTGVGKIKVGDETIEYTYLKDLSEQTATLEHYNDVLLAVKNRGNVPPAFFTMLRDMSVEDGIKFAETLLKASDEDFNTYIDNWNRKQEVADQIAESLYQDETQALADEVVDTFGEIATDFDAIGQDSATQFGEGFSEQLKSVTDTIRQKITGAFAGLLSGLSESQVAVSVNVGESVTAMAKGGIVTSPTHILAGEDGAEAIIPLENHTGFLDAVSRKINNDRFESVKLDTSPLTDILGQIYDRLNRLQIVLDSGALVGETIDKIDSALADRQLLTARGV